MIIGLTGTMSAGKGELAKYLKAKGFEYHSYSKILIEEAKKRGIEPTRKNLQKLGNDIKKEKKNLGILSKMILDNIKTDKAIADGVRNPDEIRELRKNGAVIIAIDAPQKLRFKRLQNRSREGDPKTFEDFKKLDDKENQGVTKGQQINQCINMADYTMMNDKTLDDLRMAIEKILKSIS